MGEKGNCNTCGKLTDEPWLSWKGECLSCMMKAIGDIENTKVLAKVKTIASAGTYNFILSTLAQGGCTDYYGILDYCKGEYFPHIHGNMWVYQTCNGGKSGDEFAGQIYILIGEGEWFKFSYSV